MGWSGGSDVMREIINAIQNRITDSAVRKEVYKEIIVALEDKDWDTQNECEEIDPIFDAALRELHPKWYERAE